MQEVCPHNYAQTLYCNITRTSLAVDGHRLRTLSWPLHSFGIGTMIPNNIPPVTGQEVKYIGQVVNGDVIGEDGPLANCVNRGSKNDSILQKCS